MTKTNLLIIDDDLRLTASVKALFEDGWTVYTAGTAEEARAFNNGVTFQVVLSDWDLGWNQPNGGELVEELRSYRPEATYIIWSGLDREVPHGVTFFSKGDLSELIDFVNGLP